MCTPKMHLIKLPLYKAEPPVGHLILLRTCVGAGGGGGGMCAAHTILVCVLLRIC